MKKNRVLIILWLDNLGKFHRYVEELKLDNIKQIFKGGTIVKNLITGFPSVTQVSELILKTGCSLLQIPVMGDKTFDRQTQRIINLNKEGFDRSKQRIVRISEGMELEKEILDSRLKKKLLWNLGFKTCQIGWEHIGYKQIRSDRLVQLEDEEASYLEFTGSVDIIPARIEALLGALRDYKADIYLVNISGDTMIHTHGHKAQVEFLKTLDRSFPKLVDGICASIRNPILLMLSDHGPKEVEDNIQPEIFLMDVPGLVVDGTARNSVCYSNGRSCCFINIRNPKDGSWSGVNFEELRSYQGHDVLSALVNKEGVSFVITSLERGTVVIISRDGRSHLTKCEKGYVYRVVDGKDPLDFEDLDGKLVVASEVLKITYASKFPYPVQWLELMGNPRAPDIMVVCDNKFSFFGDMPWIKTTHGGPSHEEITGSLYIKGWGEKDILCGRELEYGLLTGLHPSICKLLSPSGYRIPISEKGLLF